MDLDVKLMYDNENCLDIAISWVSEYQTARDNNNIILKWLGYVVRIKNT